MAEQEIRRIALLFDAENVPASAVSGMLAEVEKFGNPVVRRAFGDFNGGQATSWEQVFARHSIAPYHQFSFGRGKNAADIALVVSAMDLLHGGEVDAFCIASSDSDFLPLVIRLREQNIDCFIFGNEHTPDRVKRACSRFTHIENLRYRPDNVGSHPTMKPLRPTHEAMKLVKTTLAQVADEPGSWVAIDELEREIMRKSPNFDPRTYGCLYLRDLLVALGGRVVVEGLRDGDVRVRLRTRGKGHSGGVSSKLLAGGHQAGR